MELVLRRAGGGAALVGAVLLGTMSTGCTEEQTSFFIQGNVSVDAPQCIARAEGSAALLGVGMLDVALKKDYVGSQLTPRGDKANLRTETTIATMKGAEVHLYDDVGELDGDPFTVPANGVINPEASDDAGFGIIFATLIPATTGIRIADELTSLNQRVTRVAEVTVFGTTIGGTDIESSPFNYVIQVCEGCLVDFPAEAVDENGACSLQLDQAETAPCSPGQDEAVDCRICTGSEPFCQVPGGGP
jgi:hypothetical protein